MDVTIIQSCDATFYYPMMQETAKTVRRYCIDNGFRYEQFVGVKRGTMPWHSAYNRIYMLKEMLDRGVKGWVLYMDADSMIIDHLFDLRKYLDKHDHLGGIFSGYQSSELPYAINSGGFAINLDHPIGRSLVYDYWRITADIPDGEFEKAVFWGPDVFEDQYLLHLVLEQYMVAKDCGRHILFEPPDGGYVNSGPFISQVLRVAHPDFASRLTAIKARVAQILATLPPEGEERSPGIYLVASHPRAATACGHKRHSAIRSGGSAGVLLYGPYIRLAAGRWRGRVYGEARIGSDQPPMTIRSDVTADAGGRQLSEASVTLPRSQKGMLIEHRFDLSYEAIDVELRIVIEAGHDIDVHAIEFLP